MPLPKFSDLSSTTQIVVILVVGVSLWGVTEYLMLQPVKDANAGKLTQVNQLEAQLVPLRPFREKVRALEADNRQLENQLENLRRIVPNEKEVDNFVRLLQSEASTAGVLVRRVTAKTAITQPYYVEVPFEMELDGSYFDVQQFYERLGRVERITNVSDLKLGTLISNTGATAKKYDYGANETVMAVCTVTTFFSKEESEATAAAAPAKGKPGAKAAPAKAPPKPAAAR
jgi:type IV pilus assembly protein PilO